MACAQYGPTAPFTQAIIEALGNQICHLMTGNRLLGLVYLEEIIYYGNLRFAEQCGITAGINRRQRQNTTYEMMVGEGDYRGTNNQLNYLPGAYPHISAVAL